MFAISNDSVDDARRMATTVGLDFPGLSNPSMDVVYRYRMKGERTPMPDLGYVLIDATGRGRVHKIERQFGGRVSELIGRLSGVLSRPPGREGRTPSSTCTPCW